MGIFGWTGFGGPVWAAGPEPALTAKAAVLMDADSGEILYALEGTEPMSPASTTKVMTALLALERGSLETPVRVSGRAASVGEASIQLKADDVMSVEELLYGALMRSGNDACVALAEALAPSEEEFVSMMNLKAKCLGAFQTRFVNTNGLTDEADPTGHRMSARDLALISRAAMGNPVFASITRQKNHELKWIYPDKTVSVANTNRLLWMDDRITGIKTGTTDLAGKCLAASFQDHGHMLIAVVLNAADRYEDAMRLFRYGMSES
jgi:D-alanyl-D-alanine carboxypeptidase (penicillin-binding protein 5/6)